ncbi:MAG: hypothetical protein GXY34_13570 [Syntrophomonadaceae bacterium]|nr:hypothetical protein [Syntrophomonadaceae bacterium]
MRLYLAIVAAIIIISATLDHDWFLQMVTKPRELAGWLVAVCFGASILFFFLLGARVICQRSQKLYAIGKVESTFFGLIALAALVLAFVNGFIDGSAALAGAILLIAIFDVLLFIFWRSLAGIVQRIRLGDAQYALTNREFFPIVLLALVATLALGMSDQETFINMGAAALIFIIAALTYVFSIMLYWIYWTVKALIRWPIFSGKKYEFTEQSFVYHGIVRDLVLNWEDIQSVEVINTEVGVGPVPPKPGFPTHAPGLLITASGRPGPDLIMDSDPQGLGQKIMEEKARR